MTIGVHIVCVDETVSAAGYPGFGYRGVGEAVGTVWEGDVAEAGDEPGESGSLIRRSRCVGLRVGLETGEYGLTVVSAHSYTHPLIRELEL